MDSVKPFPGIRGESAFLYVSELSPDVDRGVVHEMARASRVRNRANGITGLLMFDGSSFAQWLEGPVQAMDHLLTRLRADPRHHRMEVLWFESPGLGRRYPQWHFGYLGLQRGSQGLRRLRGTRGADAMLLFGELGRGLVAEERLSSVGRAPIAPMLHVAREPELQLRP